MDLQEIKLANGSILASITGYGGEEDFYVLHDTIEELLSPDNITYGVDSMGVSGSFRKDGIFVRISSECITDCCCFHYDAGSMAPEEIETVKGWINQIVAELHKKLPR